jgi:hypothetical protein
MSTALDDAIIERIGFLKEQLGAEDDPGDIRTFQGQIYVLQNAQLDRLDELIIIRRTDLQLCKNVFDADRIFAELEALEWLQRQVLKFS